MHLHSNYKPCTSKKHSNLADRSMLQSECIYLLKKNVWQSVVLESLDSI